RHATEPVRPPAFRVSGDLAHRRGGDGGRTARRPGHLAAFPVLRGAPSAARLLAEPPDARVLRPVGALRARPGTQGTPQGGRAAPDVSHRRSVAPDAQRDAARGSVADDPGPAAALRGDPERAALSTAAGAGVP